jgi:hypothetical protein
VKIFIDTANIDEIREALRFGILDGASTNSFFKHLVMDTGLERFLVDWKKNQGKEC